jgi:hypothetical protein
MNKDIKKVIFIGGSSYSGSTMLDMMMANSIEGFSLGEVCALFRPYRPHHFNPECGCGNSNCDFWLQVRNAGEEHLYETIFKLLPDVSFIVDSSKDPWWIQRQTEILQRKNIDVYNLLIWKEPASFAHSMKKRKRNGWAKAWENYYRLYFTLINTYISVPYSNLAQHPNQILQDLCRKCGLSYHEDKEKFWQKQHHTLFGNNSAKIHLHTNNSSDTKQSNDHLARSDNKPKHRTIYHDTSYLQSVPASVRCYIDNNADLKEILSTLNNMTSPSEDIQYSSCQVIAAKARWEMKRLCGRVLGRYWRLF